MTLDLANRNQEARELAGEPVIFRQPLRRKVKFALRDALAQTLLPVARLNNRFRPHLPILSYHRVLPDFPAGSSPSAVVSPEAFENQLKYLVRAGYTALSLESFKSIIENPAGAPPRPVLITFDDGYADNGLIAHEIGRKCGVTLNFFIPTGIIGRDEWPYHWGIRPPQDEWHMARHPELWRPLTWDEVREMERGGAGIGCHGYLHRRLSRLARCGLRQEIGDGIATFIDKLGRHPKHFTIPWGDRTAYHGEALSLLRASGIECIYTTQSRRTPLPVTGDVFPRISIREHDDLAAFARKLDGANDLLQYLLLR